MRLVNWRLGGTMGRTEGALCLPARGNALGNPASQGFSPRRVRGPTSKAEAAIPPKPRFSDKSLQRFERFRK